MKSDDPRLGSGERTGPGDVLEFWRGAGPAKWFAKDLVFDAEVAKRFSSLWDDAVAGNLSQWEETAEGALALVIVLDQFPRNMFRGEPRTYQADAMARAVADRALARGFDRRIPDSDLRFLYLPFMHSERLVDQERCLEFARSYGDDEFTRYAQDHADIVRRFGRFPHRNVVLGRTTTREEQDFLDSGGFAG
jgi:uncharacterized protein (DUF924 family)